MTTASNWLVTCLPPGEYSLSECRGYGPKPVHHLKSVQCVNGLTSCLVLGSLTDPARTSITPVSTNEWTATISEGTAAFDHLNKFMEDIKCKVGSKIPTVERFRFRITETTSIFFRDGSMNEPVLYDATTHPALTGNMQCVLVMAPPLLCRDCTGRNPPHWIMNLKHIAIIQD